MTRIALALVFLLPGLVAPLALAEEGAIEVDLAWASGRHEAYYEHTVDLSSGSALGVKVPFGPDTVLLVRQRQISSRRELTIDRNFNGTLEDEKAVDFAIMPLEFDGFPSPEKMVLKQEATEIVHPPWAPASGLQEGVRIHLRMLNPYSDDGKVQLTVLLNRRGHVVLEGRERLVALYDGNGDLCFDHPTEDYLFLDIDGDRSIPRSVPSHERIQWGQAFRVRDAGYVPTLLGSHGERVRFEPSKTVPEPSRVWKPEEVPPTGVEHEGTARPLSDLTAEYVERKAEYKKNRTPMVRLKDLVLEIGRTGRAEAFTFLLEVYREHTSPSLRAAVAEAMGDVRYVEFASRLVRIAQKDKDRKTREAAIASLHKMGAPDRGKKLAGIARGEKDLSVFRAAVVHLGYLGTPEAQKTLIGILRKCAKKADRAYHAYHAATRFATEAPSAAVIEIGADAQAPRLKGLALEDAFQLPYPQGRDLALGCLEAAKDYPVVRKPVLSILGAAGDAPSVKALLGLAPALDAKERKRAIKLVQATRDPAAMEVVRDALSARTSQVRALAAAIAIVLPDPELAALVSNRLRKEEDDTARLELVRAAGEHRAAGAIPVLLATLRSTKTDEVLRRAALNALLSVGFEHAEVTEYLLQVGRTAKWEVRLRIMDAAAESGERGAAPLLIQGLTADSWQIRLAAVDGLTRIRVKESIGPLIERLVKEEKPRVHRAVVNALFVVTGQNLYDVVDVWKRWWKEKGEAFEVPEEIPERPQSDDEGTYGVFYGIPVDAMHVIFVIDQSGSMDSDLSSITGGQAGSDFQRAVAEVRAVLSKLPNGAFVNVIFFESAVHAWKSDLVKLNRGTRKDLDEWLGKKSPMGATNLYDALEQALKTRDVETIYLLSDGSPNMGKYTDDLEILDAVEEINWKNRAVIHTVALGYRSELLAALSEQSGGTAVTR